MVVIFLDAAAFLDEAIESVVAQTYESWELILVDDGSADGSTAIARRWSESRPRQIHYVEHPGHENLGMSASRNAGLRQARGSLIALLDADDVWSPEKLATQVGIMKAHPGVGMVSGRTEYWFSWDSDAPHEDWVQEHHIPADRIYQPPVLVAYYLRGEASLPSTCSVMFRADAARHLGGFEESFRTLYEDQVFFAKMCLAFPVYVSSLCLERYRQHQASASALAGDSVGSSPEHRARYLRWLRDYLRRQRIDDGQVWEGLGMAFWMARAAGSDERPRRPGWDRWLRKWVVRASAVALPRAWCQRIWRRERLFEE